MIQHCLVVLGLVTIFGLGHSLAAQDGFKRQLASRLSPFFVDHFWRFIYCYFSWLYFYFVFVPALSHMDPSQYRPLFDPPLWLRASVDGVHVLGIVVSYWAFLQFDYLEFWGIKQLWRGVRSLWGAPLPPLPLCGVDKLEVRGIYGWVRHPMLLGLMLLWFPMPPSPNSLCHTIMLYAYVFIGAHYEEKRMLRNFGTQYAVYMRDVGGFFTEVAAPMTLLRAIEELYDVVTDPFWFWLLPLVAAVCLEAARKWRGRRA